MPNLADRLEEEADEITCYASTQSEYRPNKTAALLREAAKALLSSEGVPSTLLSDAADPRFSDALIGLRFRAWLGVI